MHKTPHAIFVVTLLSVISCVLIAHADGGPAESVTLSNGFKFILKKDPLAGLVALELWVGAGSADENPGQEGIAHVVEHTLFRGSSADGQTKFAGRIESLGARLNAFTARDQTVFHFVLPAHQLNHGLKLLAQLVQLPSPEQARPSKEIQVVLHEWKQGQDNPASRALVSLFKQVYGDHPYGRPVLGTPETLKQLSWDDINQFYNSWYVANNMTLVVAGNFSPDAAKREIEGLFSAIRHGPLPPQNRPPLTVQLRPRLNLIKASVDQGRLALGFPIPPGADPQNLPLDLLAFILGSGESSRLARRVKIEQGLVHSASAYTSKRKGPGIFVVRAETEPGKTLAALRAILSEVYRLREQPVEPSELTRALANFHRFFVESKETVQKHARQLGRFQRRYGTPDYEASYLNGLRVISSDALRGAAQQFLQTDKLSLSLVIPRASHLPLDDLGLEQISLQAEKKFGAPASPAQDRIVKASLEKGLRIVIQENTRLPLVSIHATATGGIGAENAQNNGIHNFIVSMLTKGTARITALKLAHEVEQIAGTMSGSISHSTVSFSATFPEQELGQGIELFLDALFHSSFPEESLEKTRAEILRRIKNDEERLRAKVTRLFYQALFAVHPYRLSQLGRREVISAISRQELLDRYRQVFAPDRTVVAIVGRVNGEKLLLQLRERLISLKRQGFQPPSPEKESSPEKKRIQKQTVQTHQSHLVIGFMGPSQMEPEYFSMKAAEVILSHIGGRLFRSLRDEKGLAYAIRAFTLDNPVQGAFAVYAATDPNRVDETREGILSELRKLQEAEVSSEELDRAKNYLLGSFEIRRQTNRAIASDLALKELFGSIADPETYRQGIHSVTAAHVQSFARKFLMTDRYTLAVLGP